MRILKVEEEMVHRSKIFRNKTRNYLQSLELDESGNDVSKIYTKRLLTLKPIYGTEPESSSLIELGEYKWTFRVLWKGTSIVFVLFADEHYNPKLDFYALLTLAIIHPRDPIQTDFFDYFLFVCEADPGNVFELADVLENGFLDAEGNITVEVQIQVIGDNVFPPLLVPKFQIELFKAYSEFVDKICYQFIEETRKTLMRFCILMNERGQISDDQIYWVKQDVIEKGLVEHFSVEGAVTCLLLMEILYKGYKSITTNNTTAQFIRIENNRFGLVGDVRSLYMSVVGIQKKLIHVSASPIEDYESILTKLGCMIVEIYVVDYLFRNKIEIAEGLEEDMSLPDTVRAQLNDLFMNARKEHEEIATTLKEKICVLNAEPHEEHVACALKKAVAELFMEEQKKVSVLYVVETEEESVRRSRRIFRNDTRKFLESSNLDESGNDVSKIYTKRLLTLKPMYGSEPVSSSLIEFGEYKWTFRVHWNGTSLRFVLFADKDNNPRLDFYALLTSAIIHPHNPRRTDFFDYFLFVCEADPGNVFELRGAREKGFLDAEGNIKVEVQIQVIGECREKVFPPLLVPKFRIELFSAYLKSVDKICSRFIEETKEKLKTLLQDENKWLRFCIFMNGRRQISEDQMYWEKQDVIKKGLVRRFFVEGVVTSPLLMEILYNGYKSITTNNTMAQFIRIEENRFELVGDVPSLFKSVVGIEYKPIKISTHNESIFTKLGCMIVEIYVVDYLFRNKIEVNFTRSELIQTEKKSKKKGKKKAKPKKNDKCVEQNKQKQNDEVNFTQNEVIQTGKMSKKKKRKKKQNDGSIAPQTKLEVITQEKYYQAREMEGLCDN